MTKYFTALLMFFVVWPSFAADLNGYTAQYECRAGGAYCNVDVVSLGERTCDQTIKASTPWSSINWSSNTICIEAGDHTSKGTLTIPSSANGKPGNYKVLRYYRADDSDDEPWNQSGANRATLRNLNVQGSFWIIHRLSFDSNYVLLGGSTVEVSTGSVCDDNIINRILVEKSGSIGGVRFRDDCSRNTLQNSVIRLPKIAPGSDINSVDIDRADNTVIVNNELIDAGHGIGVEDSSLSTNALIVENNDIYKNPALFTDCSGNFTPNNEDSPCVAGESAVSFKGGAQPGTANTIKVIHNRLWNTRKSDLNTCCAGGSNGFLMTISTASLNPASNVLVQNNILMSGQFGIATVRPGHEKISIIGNLLYRIHKFNSGIRNVVFATGSDMNLGEVYLNTVISATDYWGSLPNTNSDWRCNVYIDAGAPEKSVGSGSQHDNNVFYGSTPFTTGKTNKDIPLTTRANSKAYALNQIIRTSATPTTACVKGTESACFLYRVIQAGMSLNSAPSYCTTLGCIVNDGEMTVQAIRGPYTFRRKLRTVSGGETVAIPYVRPYVDPNNIQSSAPEAGACPSNYAGRTGIGVNDSN